MSTKNGFRAIKTFNSSFGNEAWRVTSDGEYVHIQVQTAGASCWRTEKRLTRKFFDGYAESVGLFDPYCQDPSLLFELCDWGYCRRGVLS